MGSSLHGSTGPARSLLQRGLPTGSQPPSEESTCSGAESSRGYRWIPPPLTSMCCRWTTCLTTVFSTSCRGISLPMHGAPPPPPSSLALVSAELFLPHILTHFSGCNCSLASFFFLLKYNRCATTIADCLGLGQQWVCLGASWHWLCWREGKLLTVSHRSHPHKPSATKTLSHKSNTSQPLPL